MIRSKAREKKNCQSIQSTPKLRRSLPERDQQGSVPTAYLGWDGGITRKEGSILPFHIHNSIIENKRKFSFLNS